MHRSLILFALLLLWPGSALADLRVVASTPDIAAVAREVGGDHAAIGCDQAGRIECRMA